MKITRFIALGLVTVLLLAACVPAAVPTGAPVKIGSKDFTEELLLGEMYAQILEANGITVERRLNLAGTQVAHEALVKGEIDVYPEYTGTGYLFILGIDDNEKDPAKVYDKTTAEYKSKWNLVWLDPAPMNNTNAVAVTRAIAEQYNLKTMSDFCAAAPNLRFAAVPDFEQRPDGLAGIKEVYGECDLKSLTVFDPGLKYKAVTDGQADAVVAFSTDGQIAGFDLVVMEDDKGLWPPYQVAPVVRGDVLDKNPKVRDALNQLASLITSDTIAALNWKVDGEKMEYTQVATDFLKEKGLVK